MKTTLAGLAATAILLSIAGTAAAHCQIPCGIYGDETRFELMLEHVQTIEKSMKQIKSLEEAEKANSNQLVRWVNNKEAHAEELSGIITYYFMAQRVKPVSMEDKEAHKKYLGEITLLHKMLIQTMKTKQTTDIEHCSELSKLIADFKQSYLGK
ncbi:superoxide dismutase [Ni] [Thermodesulfobacteriota bacterium]